MSSILCKLNDLAILSFNGHEFNESVLWKYPLVRKISGDNLKEIRSPYGRFDVKLWPHTDSSHWGRKTPTDNACVVHMRSRVPTNLVSFRKLLASTEPVITTFSVPSDVLVGRSS